MRSQAGGGKIADASKTMTRMLAFPLNHMGGEIF